jgi:hypothetical protein
MGLVLLWLGRGFGFWQGWKICWKQAGFGLGDVLAQGVVGVQAIGVGAHRVSAAPYQAWPGGIEGSNMLTLHTVCQEKRGQAGGELVVEQKSQATRTTELPAWAAA